MLKQRRVVSALSLLLLALFVQSAQAFIDPPYLTPSIPLSGQEVSINVLTGLCDAVLNKQELTREGNAIRIVFFGVRYFNPELCNLPTFTTTQSIGSYSPGSYTLQVDLMYSGGTGVIQVDTLGVIPFTVEGGPTEPIPAPTNTPLVLLLMAMAIVAIAVWKVRYRTSGWLLRSCASLSRCGEIAVKEIALPTMINGRRRILLIVACATLSASISSCSYFAESSFELAKGCRIPKWFHLLDGRTRDDVSVSVTFFVRQSGREASFVMYDSTHRKIDSAVAKVHGHEPRHSKDRLGKDVSYDVVSVGEVVDVLEYAYDRGPLPAVCMSDDLHDK